MNAHRNDRQLRLKSHTHKVIALGGDLFRVTSGASGKAYTVDLSTNGCNCEWAHHNPGEDCSHTIAARQFWALSLTVSGLNSAPVVDGAQTQATCQRIQKAADILAAIRRQYEELNSALAHSAERPMISRPSDVRDLVAPALESLDHEELWVVLLDTRNRVQKLVRLYVGSVNSSVARASEIMRAAIVDNAPGMILVHNHPSGDASPSQEDMAVTRAIGEAGHLLDIELVDHIIIGRGRFVSLKERGLEC